MATDPLDGKTGFDRRSGQRVVRQNGQWVPMGGKPQPMEASMRARTDIGLAPMVKAQQGMAAVESKGNPFSLKDHPDNALAKAAGSIGFRLGDNSFFPLEGVAKSIGGQDFQDYEQSAAAFESQLMPIMSGAAVSPSEARRQIRASLPSLGDSPETLQKKGEMRKMMMNGAAKSKGLPLPYPEVDTWGVNTTRVPDGGQPGAGRIRKFNPQTGRIE